LDWAFFKAGVQIRLAEAPGLTLNAGENMAFDFSLPRP
jgi:hypothetical protein